MRRSSGEGGDSDADELNKSKLLFGFRRIPRRKQQKNFISRLPHDFFFFFVFFFFLTTASVAMTMISFTH